MFIRFIKYFDKNIQKRVIIWLLVIGTIAYMLDRRSGPGAVSSMLKEQSGTWFWHILALVCIILLLTVLPLFCIWREKFLPEYIYREKKIPADPVIPLKQVADIFNLDYEVLHRQFPEEMTRQHILALIKRYFI